MVCQTEPLAARCREALEKQDPASSPSAGEGVSRLAHRHPRLVHQPPALVGPSHPGLVRDQRDRWQVHRHHPLRGGPQRTEALEKAKAEYGAAAEIEQDEDVLDTWFSSGLWPFSTLGWPDADSADLQRWYPTSTLVTGFDIIFSGWPG